MMLRRKWILRTVCMIFALAMAISCSALLFGCSKPGKAESDAYAKLISDGKKLSVRAPINDDERKVFLFAIDLWQTPYDISDLEPIAKARVKHSEASATVKLEGFDLSELVCKGFVFGMKDETGEGYSPVSAVYYITNAKEAHKKGDKIDETELSGKFKGLVGTPEEVLENGASATLVTVDLGRFLKSGGGSGAYSFVFNGVSCHVDKARLDELDNKIKAYTEAGASVYLEIVQSKSFYEFGNRLSALTFEGSSGATGYALNMTTRDGVNAVCGALKLLASRYSGGEYGRVDSFIIGRTVNNYGRFYADTLSFEAGVENYTRAVRMAYNLLLLYNPNGRVYISLGNNWTVAESGGVSAKEFLTAFAGIAENGGDFFWQVSLEANASDPSDSSIWDDPLAVWDAQFISPANVDMVVKLLGSSAYKCNGYLRNIVLNRFAIGGTGTSAQAASYAYAYYTALSTKRVEAMIYAEVTDSSSIGAGLYTTTNAPKQIASIFNSIDTDDVGDTSYISTLVGETWSKLYFEGSKLSKNRYVIEGALHSRPSGKEISLVADFSKGDAFGFYPFASDYVELQFSDEDHEVALYTSVAGDSFVGGGGAVTDDITLKSIKDAGYLAISTNVESERQSARLTVRLLGYDKDGNEIVYVADDEVRANEWFDGYYEIEDFIKKVDSENVTLVITVDEGSTGLWLSRISTLAPDKAEFPFWIIWLILGLAAAGGLTAFVVWFKKNYTFVRE